MHIDRRLGTLTIGADADALTDIVRDLRYLGYIPIVSRTDVIVPGISKKHLQAIGDKHRIVTAYHDKGITVGEGALLWPPLGQLNPQWKRVV